MEEKGVREEEWGELQIVMWVCHLYKERGKVKWRERKLCSSEKALAQVKGNLQSKDCLLEESSVWSGMDGSSPCATLTHGWELPRESLASVLMLWRSIKVWQLEIQLTTLLTARHVFPEGRCERNTPTAALQDHWTWPSRVGKASLGYF